MARVRKARSKMSSTPPPNNTSSNNSTSSNRFTDRCDTTSSAARSYFQKQPFPRFSGESRDYLSFRKEWKETVAPSYDEVFQLQEVRRAVPPKIQPNLKNLRTMDEVWTTLDEEFYQIMENVSSLVRGLVAFKHSKEAKNKSRRFMELWRKWNEVYADLHELGNTSVLNHEPIIPAVGNIPPSNSSNDRYIELCLRRLEQGG